MKSTSPISFSRYKIMSVKLLNTVSSSSVYLFVQLRTLNYHDIVFCLIFLVDMDTLFKEADFVTAHTALTPQTAGKIKQTNSYCAPPPCPPPLHTFPSPVLVDGIQSFRTHGSFVPRLRRFVLTFDQFVPSPLNDSYPTNYVYVLNILCDSLLGTKRPQGWVRTGRKWVRNV